MGKIIQFPTVTEASRIVDELTICEEEIKLALDDIQDLNDMVVELTAHYEAMLDRLCQMARIAPSSARSQPLATA